MEISTRINQLRKIAEKYENDRSNSNIYNACLDAANRLEELEKEDKVIDEALEATAKNVCIGCNYLDGYKCTKETNCEFSKYLFESTIKILVKLKISI